MMGDSDGDRSVTFFTRLMRYPAPTEPIDAYEYEIAPVLDAATAFLPFFDMFGTMLKISKSDMEGNIKKIRCKSAKVPQARTFRELLQYEIDHNETKQKECASIAALWFKRGLQYTLALLELFLANKEESLVKVLDGAYEKTLKMFHSWIVQKAIMAVARMVPYRKEVMKKITYGHDALEPQMLLELEEYLTNLKYTAQNLHQLIAGLGLDSSEQV